MHGHSIKLKKIFDSNFLINAYNSIRHLEKTPAGYPGEGHKSWNSIWLYSEISTKSSNLKESTYLQEVFAQLNLKIQLARILILEPGGVIKEHQDTFLSNKIVRLHIPIITHPDVELYIAGKRCIWYSGELWYGDFSLPHSGINNSNISRVHLVIDVIADENLLNLFPVDKLPEKIKNCIYDVDDKVDIEILKRFACNFSLPAGFKLPGINYMQLEEDFLGCIGVMGGEICVFINEQPLLKAIPISEDTLKIIGLEKMAYLQYAFNNGKASKLTLLLEQNEISISLDKK